MIDFLAFDNGTGAIRARVDLIDDRMADLLARGAGIPLRDVELHDLRSRSVRAVEPQTVDPGRLAIVVATGPRGALSRRVDTSSRPVTLSIGRYVVHGLLHGPVHGDPIARVVDRIWIPLTDAVLEYPGAGRMCRERFDALLVNRDGARTLTVVDEATYETHWLAGGPSGLLPGESVGA